MNPTAVLKSIASSGKVYAMIPVHDPVTNKSYVLTSIVNDFKFNSDGTAAFTTELIEQDMKAMIETQIQTEMETSDDNA